LFETLKSYVEEGGKPEILILESNNSWATKIILQLPNLCRESAASKAVPRTSPVSCAIRGWAQIVGVGGHS